MRGAWGAEGVVLQEGVAVEEVDLADGSLGDEIENVGPGSSEPNDGDLAQLELVGDRDDLCLRRS